MKSLFIARDKSFDNGQFGKNGRLTLRLALSMGCLGLATALAQADAPAGAWWLQDAPSPAPKQEEAKPAPKKEEAKPAPKQEETKPAPKKEEAKPAPAPAKAKEEAKPAPKKDEPVKAAPAKAKEEPAKPVPKPEAPKAEAPKPAAPVATKPAAAPAPTDAMKEVTPTKPATAPAPATSKPAGEVKPVVETKPATPAPAATTPATAPAKPTTAAPAKAEPLAPAPMLPTAVGPGRPAATAPTLAPTPAIAPEPEGVKPVTLVDDKFVLPISDVVLVYDSKASELIPVEQVRRNLMLTLAQTEMGLTAPGAAPAGSKVITFALADINKLSDKRFTASAIQVMSQQIVSYFNQQGIIGVAVGPHPADVNAKGEDLRKETQVLRMVARIGVVKEVRTLASGERIAMEERVNNPVHERIKRNAPVQDGQAINKTAVDSYLGYVNRHPNRRVDVALSRGVEEGTIALDYLVAENKPWLVYGQLSNTGTEQTDIWRQRFGFNHSQLTNNDDIFDLQYTTASFDSAHFVQASYEAPFFDVQGLRWKVFGHYSEYTASDVGVAGLTFEGESWSAGGQLIYNLLQQGDFFVDAFGGARWDNVKVSGGANGEDDFFIPMIGVSTGYRSPTVNVDGMVSLEWNADGVAGTDATQVTNLGRALADTDFVTLQWGTGISFYLEPLFNHEAWSKADVKNDEATLAHELSFSFEGQYGIDGRLPANYQRTAGGLYSVRGYRESAAAGDTVLIGRAEYRFHIPRMFPANSMGSVNDPFGNTYQLSRSSPYGRADWDLIFRGFVDVGQTFINDIIAGGESENTLVGTGVGLELLIKQNISLRMDWGIALTDVDNSPSVTNTVTAGSNRFHFVFTFLY